MLQVKKIPFTSYEVASDEDAKKLWKRKAPLCECRSSFDLPLICIIDCLTIFPCARLAKQQLPGLLVGGVYPGGYDELYVPHIPYISITRAQLTNETSPFGTKPKRRSRRMRRPQHIPPSQRRMGRRALRSIQKARSQTDRSPRRLLPLANEPLAQAHDLSPPDPDETQGRISGK